MMTDEQKKLVEENHNMIYGVIHKCGLSINEYYDIAAIGLCNAAINFNENCGVTFCTYAYACMLQEIRKEINRLKCCKRIPSNMLFSYDKEQYEENSNMSDYIHNLKSDVDVERAIITKQILEDLYKRMSDKDKEICNLIYLGYTQSEIAKIYGCTRQNISSIKMKIKKFIV